MRWMVALGIKSGRERKHVGGTKLHTEAAGLAALDDNGNTSFGHWISTLGDGRTFPETLGDYALPRCSLGVTEITDVREAAHTFPRDPRYLGLLPIVMECTIDCALNHSNRKPRGQEWRVG
jgi:hypothetical protein